MTPAACDAYVTRLPLLEKHVIVEPRRNTFCTIHYAHAKSAAIVDGLESKNYGGKYYSCRAIEGHSWWFDTYDPWKQ